MRLLPISTPLQIRIHFSMGSKVSFLLVALILLNFTLTLLLTPVPLLELTKQGLVVPTGSSQKPAEMTYEEGREEDDDGEKKKKGKKNRSGGKLWVLADKAFLQTAPVKSDD